MHKAADVLGLVAAHFTIIEPRLGALGSFGSTRRQAPPLLKTMCLEEAAQCPVRRHRPQLRRLLGERNQIVVMELGGPGWTRIDGQRIGQTEPGAPRPSSTSAGPSPCAPCAAG